MSDTVRVARMRLRRARDGSSDGYAAVRALDLAPPAPDRSVLVIRRLTVPAADPRTAGERVAALRRGAARPALGPVPSDCPAVVFSDEVEAMSCLTADLVNGRAADRWYWPASARTGPADAGVGAGAGAGAALARLWLDRPTWVPATLAHFARRSPALAEAAVGLLSDGQALAVLDAVRAVFRAPAAAFGPATGPASAGAGLEGLDDPDVPASADRRRALPPDRAEATTALRPAGQALLRLGLTLAVTPWAAGGSQGGREAGAAWRTAGDRADARSTAQRMTGGGPAVRGRAAEAWPVALSRTGTTSVSDAVQHPADVPAGALPVGEAVPGPADAPSRLRSVRGAAHRPAGAVPDVRPPAAPARPRWSGWGMPVESRFATLFYAVNLMTWLGLPRLDAPEPGSGWGTLEALGRALLGAPPAGPGHGTGPEDPVWGILAELDGREPSLPSPVGPEGFADRLHELLARHGLLPQVFAQPGTLVVGRTHVDVVLGLEQIDLTARSCGLDQDPGWVPALGRIIAFHFDGGS
ncbi:hypothetical protein OG407_49755 [Streptomyces sp. NBC_01515]|uniref:hypothetical protein n=1 Tax=Streptomyces sp. NBC_01515 TaxID=2903890 RepID=UPI003866053D